MAEMNVHQDLNGQGNELKNWALENLATDPTGGGLYTGRRWYNTTDNTIKYYDGTAVQTVASLEALTSIGTFQGVHDASGGAVPSTTLDGSAIVAGDYWRVSVAGTIVGLGGEDVVEVGDLIFATVNGASTAAQFEAVQANINLPSGISLVEEVVLANLAANTATAIPTTFTNAYHIQVFNNANEEILLKIAGPITARTAESNQALTNVRFVITGN